MTAGLLEPSPAHGTYGRYQVCKDTPGGPCQACKQAAAAYRRNWRKRKGPAQAHERWLATTRHLALERMAKWYPTLFEFELTEVRREVPDPAKGQP